ncbi:MAG: transposase, partial [Deferrisomatales bacterium]
FAKRMYVYNYRLFDRYDRPVASLAVLADDVAGWRPQGFHYDLWGSRAGLAFPTVKLLEYAERTEELEQNPNPFAWATAAHLGTLATRGDPERRLGWKLRLAKRLYDRGYGRQDILDLYAFIDWLMALPSDLETRFHEEFTRFEAEKKMRYVTSAERIGLEKGIQQGIQQGIHQRAHTAVIEVLETRFGVVPQSVAEAVGQVTQEAVLSMLLKRAVVVESLDAFREDLQRALS